MSWSSKRKNKYIIVALFVILIPIILFLFFSFYTEPTCFDGKQNADEEGVDCGGSCQVVCGFKIIDPIVQWSRVSKTNDGVYSAVAMIENLNVSAEASGIPYVFKLFDEEGLLISEKRGLIFIPANSTFPVFEGGIKVGNRVPVRTTFELTRAPYWVKSSIDYNSLITIKNVDFQEKNNTSKVLALIENNTIREIKGIELIVLLLDGDGNLINSSKTIIGSIKKDSSENAIFTWPILFDKKIAKIDLMLVSKIE
ncbi:MAG: hypothetical protein V1851_02970 [Patescibacteria group bacterium]